MEEKRHLPTNEKPYSVIRPEFGDAKLKKDFNVLVDRKIT